MNKDLAIGIAAIMCALFGFFIALVADVFYIDKTTPCHCHYRTTDDRFREGYTKANKPCEPQPNGHVKIGDTVYTNITEYRCE
jgi:hypothetical protein